MGRTARVWLMACPMGCTLHRVRHFVDNTRATGVAYQERGNVNEEGKADMRLVLVSAADECALRSVSTLRSSRLKMEHLHA
jgi:hypothetical protein